MKIRIVHTLRADWLYGVRIKTSIMSVLGTIWTIDIDHAYAYNLINI